ncbi:unnamed protein product, partial [Rotaria magnacalcarata]
YVNFDLLKAIV